MKRIVRDALRKRCSYGEAAMRLSNYQQVKDRALSELAKAESKVEDLKYLIRCLDEWIDAQRQAPPHDPT